MPADTSQQEAELAARAGAGDRLAFSTLMQLTKQPLYRFVRRYVGSDDDAYDIVQDSYIAAWRALSEYDPERPFGPWLRTIALNKCRDFGRRQAVKAKARSLLSLFFPVETATPAPEMEEELQRLDRAVASLPPFYKEALLLTAIGGLSHKEAAEQLGTTVKAIEMRVRRARLQLQEMLRPDT